jgi:hypothetical protein
MSTADYTGCTPAPEAKTNTMKRDVFDHLPEFYKAVATVLIRSGRLSIVE